LLALYEIMLERADIVDPLAVDYNPREQWSSSAIHLGEVKRDILLFEKG
jgi:hypothetical protein